MADLEQRVDNLTEEVTKHDRILLGEKGDNGLVGSVGDIMRDLYANPRTGEVGLVARTKRIERLVWLIVLGAVGFGLDDLGVLELVLKLMP